MTKGIVHRVHHVRHLDAATYVLRFDRHGLSFEPGQYVTLGFHGSIAMRDYSIYSGADDDFLEVLVRQVRGGLVSRALARCEPGDALAMEGPHGFFVTTAEERGSARYLFVATGTGISPFHCMTRSYPRIDYQLLHGVRAGGECYDSVAFDPARYVACLSRQPGAGFSGRVTRYLREHRVDPGCLCYLCGNSAMINEAFALLRNQGVPREHLFAEVYF